MVRRTFAGTPATKERGGICIPWSTTEPAATTRASSDHSVVENSCVHSDKAVVLNDASVHDCTVADGHSVPDCAWGIRIGVEHCVVLDVGFSSMRMAAESARTEAP